MRIMTLELDNEESVINESKLKNVFSEVIAKKVCFISGSNRSGTTLLSNILDAHSKLLSCPESSFLLCQKSFLTSNKKWTKRRIQYGLKYLWIRKRAMRGMWKQDLESLQRVMLSNTKQMSAQNYIKMIYSSYKSCQNISEVEYFVDKNPGYVWELEKLKDIFPNAKFIFIVRNYKDRMASFKKLKKFGVINAFLVRGLNWRNHQEQIFNFMENCDQAIIINYESLVTNLSVELKRICEFLSIDFDEKLLTHYEANVFQIRDEDLKTDSKLDIDHFKRMHKKSTEAISEKYIDQYLEKLTPREVTELDYACSQIGRKLGYDTNEPVEISLYSKLKVKFYLFIGRSVAVFDDVFNSLPLSIQFFVVSILRKMLLKKHN